MNPLYTTLNKIRACHPCKHGWDKLLKHLVKTQADDDLLPFAVIVESNGIDDALWCCQTAPEYAREWRLYGVWCALQVKHLMTDERSLTALIVAEDFANGRATVADLNAAMVAAVAAAVAAWAAARAAVGNAAWAARAARVAAGNAAWSAAGDAALAAGDEARTAQKEVFMWVVTGGLAKWEAQP